MPNESDPLEAAAQRVLECLLGGEVVPRDVPPAQGLRDFDLVDSENLVQHAVEVTSVQLPSVRAARTSMERLSTESLGLTQSWSVTVHESADLRPVAKNAPALLNELTARGVDRFVSDLPRADRAAATLTEQLGAVGVVQGFAMPTVLPPRLMLAGYGSGSIDPSNVTTAVESELAKADNRRKLAAAPAGATRHLFIWLHDSHWYVSSVLRDSAFPLPPAPLLPSEVDVAWVAVADGKPGRVSTLLRVDASGIVAIDLDTGAPIPLRGTNAVEGPPYRAPSCPNCHSQGDWVVTQRTRVDPKTGEKTAIAAWDAICIKDASHFRRPGRVLSKRELNGL